MMLIKHFKEFVCLISGHDFIILKKYNFMKEWELLECERCKNKFILSHETKSVVPYSKELDLAGEGIMYDERKHKKNALFIIKEND